MFWEQEKDAQSHYVVPDDVVDLVFSISCKCLPLDHAYSISTALRAALPWLDDEAEAGIHLIHGAESGNGWMRPEDNGNELLHLSRRSRMTLRVPKPRIDDARALTGQTLLIDDHPLQVGAAKVKPFSTLSTQFARYVVVPEGVDHGDEAAFMVAVVEQLKVLDIKVRKLMCGRGHAIRHPAGDLYTRSVMLADLDVDEAVALQRYGIGAYRKMGCGLFIPHKGIGAVHELNAEQKS